MIFLYRSKRHICHLDHYCGSSLPMFPTPPVPYAPYAPCMLGPREWTPTEMDQS